MERICAGCFNFVPKGADYCKCGFDNNILLEQKTVEVIELHANELLYLAYYEARLAQAEEHLKNLIGRHGRRGWSLEQRTDIKNALRSVSNSKATIKQQHHRVAHAAQHLQAMLPRIEVDRMLTQLARQSVTPSCGLQADVQRLTTPQPRNTHAGAKVKI
jgi:predicted ATP-binding protein involved in virulence